MFEIILLVEIKIVNVSINNELFFEQPIKNKLEVKKQ